MTASAIDCRSASRSAKLEILGAGAYTTAYSSVGFNGFPPLKEYCF